MHVQTKHFIFKGIPSLSYMNGEDYQRTDLTQWFLSFPTSRRELPGRPKGEANND